MNAIINDGQTKHQELKGANAKLSHANKLYKGLENALLILNRHESTPQEELSRQNSSVWARSVDKICME
jgi:hypothetical protein